MTHSIELAGEELVLHAEKALSWPARRTLLIADPHFGKAAAFRHAGIPVPTGTTRADLDRLSALLAATGAERLIVLGDFFHCRHGLQPATLTALQAWRRDHAQLDVRVVVGNHDRSAGLPDVPWEGRWLDPPHREGPFLLCHEPAEHEGGYVLAGHLHPAACLSDAAGRVRVPCFHFGAKVGVLPAFGGFTGMKSLRRRAGERVYLVAGQRVILWG